MPVALTFAPDPQIPLSPPRMRWTRAECEVLESNGIWDQQKLELIHGELITKLGQKRPHVTALMSVMNWLVDTFGWNRVNQSASIDVAPEDNPFNEPEPDLILFALPTGFQLTTPQPDELALVVEIADSTLRFDLTVKAELYARAGIVEYWVLDLTGRRLIVHCEPQAGGYRSIIAYSDSEKVAPLASPENELLVGDIFES